MPYHIEKDTVSCPESKPFAVVKNTDGDIMGCHATEDQAKHQLAALYANEKEQ